MRKLTISIVAALSFLTLTGCTQEPEPDGGSLYSLANITRAAPCDPNQCSDKTRILSDGRIIRDIIKEGNATRLQGGYGEDTRKELQEAVRKLGDTPSSTECVDAEKETFWFYAEPEPKTFTICVNNEDEPEAVKLVKALSENL